QPSQHSTDRSKSFSQIYSEILEESKERQEKAERACRNYHIHRPKFKRNHDIYYSESGSFEEKRSLGSRYSDDTTNRSRKKESPSADELDFENLVHQEQQNIVDYQDKESLASERSSFKRLVQSDWEEYFEGDYGIDIDLHSRSDVECTRSHGRTSLGKKQGWTYHNSGKRHHDVSSVDECRSRSPVNQSASSVLGRNSVYSKPRKRHSKNGNSEKTIGHDYVDNKTSRSVTIISSRSGAQRNDLSSGSRRQQCDLKTYQDRGNSPINIKTTRTTCKCHGCQVDSESDKAVDCSLDGSSTSIGVQYPSDNENEVPANKIYNKVLIDNFQCRTKEAQIAVISKFVQDFLDDELRMPPQVEHENCTTSDHSDDYNEIYSERSGDGNYPYEGEELTNEYDQDVYSNEDDSQNTEDLQSDQIINDGDIASVSVNSSLKLSPEENWNMPKNPLNMKIYDADEALMEMPENFKGPAIILDENAAFLDITLTDDEEKIKAKLMAAALSTRRTSKTSSTSSSPKSSAPASELSVLSYRPSVVFTRRSRAHEEDPVPDPNDRVALMAEHTLRVLSRQYTNWLPLEELVDPNPNAWEEMSSKYQNCTNRQSQHCTNRQSLSEEFNRKLQRQMKAVAESFQ
ncbi:hypothetical protein KR018_010502, partial [Drosophila ironensis]